MRQFSSVVQNPHALRILAVRLFGQAGDGLLQTSLATFVLFSPERQTSAAKVAVVFAISLIPYSVIGPFAGVAIDRWARRNILLVANLLRVVIMGALAVTVATHHSGLGLAFLTLFTLGINRFLQATLSASLAHVVHRSVLTTANALFPTLGTIAATLATAFGLLIQKVLGNHDSTNALLICIAMTGASTAAFVAYRIQPVMLLGPDGAQESWRTEMRNAFSGIAVGIQTFVDNLVARFSVLAATCQRTAFGALTLYTLIHARLVWHDEQHVGVALRDFGICVLAAAAGAFVAAITAASINSPMKLKKVAQYSTLVGATAMLFGMASEKFLVVMMTAGVVSFAGQLLKINADTTIQLTVEDVRRGRLFSLFDMMINVGIVLGVCIFALVPHVADTAFPGAFIATALMLLAFVFTQKVHRHSR